MDDKNKQFLSNAFTTVFMACITAILIALTVRFIIWIF